MSPPATARAKSRTTLSVVTVTGVTRAVGGQTRGRDSRAQGHQGGGVVEQGLAFQNRSCAPG
jgi:hypothetical protein